MKNGFNGHKTYSVGVELNVIEQAVCYYHHKIYCVIKIRQEAALEWIEWIINIF